MPLLFVFAPGHGGVAASSGSQAPDHGAARQPPRHPHPRPHPRHRHGRRRVDARRSRGRGRCRRRRRRLHVGNDVAAEHGRRRGVRGELRPRHRWVRGGRLGGRSKVTRSLHGGMIDVVVL